jgi:hypothetical protein
MSIGYQDQFDAVLSCKVVCLLECSTRSPGCTWYPFAKLHQMAAYTLPRSRFYIPICKEFLC